MSAETLKSRLGTIGIWSFRFDQFDPYEAADAAQHIERLGFPSLWIPEVGRTEAMTLAGHLLASTGDLVVANGIARISDRSAAASAAAHRFLDTMSEGRHVLGLGLGGKLSNLPKPLGAMSTYLDAFADAWDAHPGDDAHRACVCLAAYNNNMAALATDRTDGVHTYLVNPQHTHALREQIGFGPMIAAEMPVVLTDDVDTARTVGRAHLATYINSRSHQRKFRALGFDDSDFTDGGSDRLVDSLITHGDNAIVSGIQDHLRAGADHVAVQVLGTSTLEEDLAAWSQIALLVPRAT